MTVVKLRDLTDFRNIVLTHEDVKGLPRSKSSPWQSIQRLFGIVNNSADPKYCFSRNLTKRPLESVLLYTDEDAELAKYIRYNFSALDVMTGDYLNIYTIEQPTSIRGLSAGEYWKARLDQTTYTFLQLMGWTRYKPYEKALAYQVADILGVYPEALPCIIIKEFGSPIESNEKIVVTVSGDHKTFFRGLSTIVRTTMEKLTASSVDRQINFDDFKKEFINEWSAWKEVNKRREMQTASFIFEGKTVFINKPSGQYEIRDFQNM